LNGVKSLPTRYSLGPTAGAFSQVPSTIARIIRPDDTGLAHICTLVVIDARGAAYCGSRQPFGSDEYSSSSSMSASIPPTRRRTPRSLVLAVEGTDRDQDYEVTQALRLHASVGTRGRCDGSRQARAALVGRRASSASTERVSRGSVAVSGRWIEGGDRLLGRSATQNPSFPGMRHLVPGLLCARGPTAPSVHVIA